MLLFGEGLYEVVDMSDTEIVAITRHTIPVLRHPAFCVLHGVLPKNK